MSLSFHINFNGNCREAFEYYAENLGGTIGKMLAFKDSPAGSQVSADWQEKIVHANIAIHNVELAGADLSPEQYQQPTGFCLLLCFPTAKDVDTTYDKLAKGGQTILAPQKTFWSSRYAIVVDKFGVPWKFNCAT